MAAYRAVHAALQGPPRRGAKAVFRCSAVDGPHGWELAKSHAGVPSVAELSITLRELATTIAPHGTFNFLLSNGQALWAHASTKADSQRLYSIERRHPFAHATLGDADLSIDFAEHTTPSDRVAVVVSSPLTTNEAWCAFAPGELRVFVDGKS